MEYISKNGIQIHKYTIITNNVGRQTNQTGVHTEEQETHAGISYHTMYIQVTNHTLFNNI